MNPRVRLVHDDPSIVDDLTMLLLLEDIERAGVWALLSARSMNIGSLYSLLLAGVIPSGEARAVALLEDIRTLSAAFHAIGFTGASTPEPRSAACAPRGDC